MTKPLDILVVGGGMYVSGRGTGSPGTIGSALLEGRRRGLVGHIGIATTRQATAEDAVGRIKASARAMGVDDDAILAFGGGVLSAANEGFAPDAAVVCVPDDLHAEVTETLCGHGVHCLVVKPMAPDTAAARRMVEAAEKAGVFGMVEFHKRLDEANLILRERVRSGALGQPLYAVVEYSQPKSIPRDIFAAWAARTSIFQYLGVHYVDLLQFITGFRPTRVSAWGQKGYLSEAGIDTWDAMQVVVEWARPDGGRFVSTHHTNWIDPDGGTAVSDQTISLVGTRGRVDSDQKHRGVRVVTDAEGARDPNPYFSASWTDPLTGHLTHSGYGIRSILGFATDVRALISGDATLDGLIATRPSFQTCMASTAVIDAAHRSLATNGTPVEIDPA